MRVLVCDKTESDAIERMRAAGIEVDVRDTISAEELLAAIQDYQGMVVRSRTKVRKEAIDAAKKLKVIVRGGVGLDNIDVDYAQSKGIAVLNTPAASSVSVAELAIGYILALSRQIVQATASMQAHQWKKKAFEGQEINGKTLGILGIGRIGKEVARLASALGMNVIAYDPYVNPVENAEIVPLDELLRRSDYITLHLPHTEETHHLIGEAQFKQMKTGIHVINCARGGVIDEEALYHAITGGIVAGAALDVFEQEPLQDYKLFSLQQVIGSPHIGASTGEAQRRIGAEVADQLIEFYRQHK